KKRKNLSSFSKNVGSAESLTRHRVTSSCTIMSVWRLARLTKPIRWVQVFLRRRRSLKTSIASAHLFVVGPRNFQRLVQLQKIAFTKLSFGLVTLVEEGPWKS